MYVCLVRYKLGNIEGSKESLDRAQGVFERRKRQFLIPGVGTYLFDFIVEEVQILTGWRCEI